MKNFKFLVAALALVLGLAACENDPELKNEITLGQSEVSIDSDGAAVTVGYLISSPIDGEKISIENNAEWLNVSTNRARTIELSATINDTGEDRSTELIISYKGAQSVKLSVIQKTFTSPFVIKINSVDATEVNVSVATQEEDITWIYWVQSKEYVDYWTETGEETLFQEDLAYLEYTAGNAEMTLEEVLERSLVVGSQNNLLWGQLQPKTEYVFYVYGMTTDGRRTTSMVFKEFTTTSVYDGEISFSFDVTEKNYYIEFTITPAHKGIPYYFGVAKESEINEWMTTYNTTDLRTAIQKGDIDASLQYFIDQMGWYDDIKDYHDFWTETDVMDYGFINADADTKYIFYAATWDENCQFNGPLSTYEYTTPPVSMSDNVITMSVTNITQSSVCVNATTTNDDPYVIIPVKSSEIAGMSDKVLVEHLKEHYEYLMGEYTYEGVLEDKVYNYMRPDTEYTLLCFGYIAGTQTTKMERYEFSTLASGNPADCTFDVFVLPNAEDAWVEIKPSDKGHFYHFTIYPSYYTVEDAKNYITALVEEYYEGDYEAFASWELSQGDEAQTVYDLYPQTEYKLGIIIMNYDKFEFLSDLVFYEPFTTPDIAYADVIVKLSYGPYYDLEELIAAGESQYESMAKSRDALFTVDVDIEGEYSEFYYDIWSGDLTDTDPVTGHADAAFYEALYEGSTYESTNFFVSYDKDMTLVAIAYDKAGLPTRITRKLLHFTKDGVSPVEDYFANKPAAAPLKAAVADADRWNTTPVASKQRVQPSYAKSRVVNVEPKAKCEPSNLERTKALMELRRTNRDDKPVVLQRLPR